MLEIVAEKKKKAEELAMDSDYERKLSNTSNGEGEEKDSIKISDKKEESVHLTRQQIIRKKLQIIGSAVL